MHRTNSLTSIQSDIRDNLTASLMDALRFARTPRKEYRKDQGTYYFPNGEVFRPRSKPKNLRILTSAVSLDKQTQPRALSLRSRSKQDLAQVLRSAKHDTPTNISLPSPGPPRLQLFTNTRYAHNGTNIVRDLHHLASSVSTLTLRSNLTTPQTSVSIAGSEKGSQDLFVQLSIEALREAHEKKRGFDSVNTTEIATDSFRYFDSCAFDSKTPLAALPEVLDQHGITGSARASGAEPGLVDTVHMKDVGRDKSEVSAQGQLASIHSAAQKTHMLLKEAPPSPSPSQALSVSYQSAKNAVGAPDASMVIGYDLQTPVRSHFFPENVLEKSSDAWSPASYYKRNSPETISNSPTDPVASSPIIVRALAERMPELSERLPKLSERLPELTERLPELNVLDRLTPEPSPAPAAEDVSREPASNQRPVAEGAHAQQSAESAEELAPLALSDRSETSTLILSDSPPKKGETQDGLRNSGISSSSSAFSFQAGEETLNRKDLKESLADPISPNVETQTLETKTNVSVKSPDVETASAASSQVSAHVISYLEPAPVQADPGMAKSADTTYALMETAVDATAYYPPEEVERFLLSTQDVPTRLDIGIQDLHIVFQPPTSPLLPKEEEARITPKVKTEPDVDLDRRQLLLKVVDVDFGNPGGSPVKLDFKVAERKASPKKAPEPLKPVLTFRSLKQSPSITNFKKVFRMFSHDASKDVPTEKKKNKKSLFLNLKPTRKSSQLSLLPVYNVAERQKSPTVATPKSASSESSKYRLPPLEEDLNGFLDLLDTFDEVEKKLEKEVENLRSQKSTAMHGLFLKDDELTPAQIVHQQRNDNQVSDESLPSKFDESELEDSTASNFSPVLSPPGQGSPWLEPSPSQVDLSSLVFKQSTDTGDLSLSLSHEQLQSLFGAQRRLPAYLTHIKQFRDFAGVEIRMKPFHPMRKEPLTAAVAGQSCIKRDVKERKSVLFASTVYMSDTFPPRMYKRYNKSVTQYYLTEAGEVNKIKNELNAYKCHEMLVHEKSKQNTQFFH